MSGFFNKEKKKGDQVKGGILAAMGGYTTIEQGRGQNQMEFRLVSPVKDLDSDVSC